MLRPEPGSEKQGWGLSGESQSLGAGITGGFLSWNQAVPGDRLGGGRFSPPGSPDRCWSGPTWS